MVRAQVPPRLPGRTGLLRLVGRVGQGDRHADRNLSPARLRQRIWSGQPPPPWAERSGCAKKRGLGEKRDRGPDPGLEPGVLLPTCKATAPDSRRSSRAPSDTGAAAFPCRRSPGSLPRSRARTSAAGLGPGAGVVPREITRTQQRPVSASRRKSSSRLVDADVGRAGPVSDAATRTQRELLLRVAVGRV